MRRATAALIRLGQIHAKSTFAPSRIAASQRLLLGQSRKEMTSSINYSSPLFSRMNQVHSIHTGRFASAAAAQVNSKDSGTPSTEGPPSEDKSEPVKPSEKAEKPAEAEKKVEAEKKGPETQEQKLLKEVKKLEQLLREKDSMLEEKTDLVKELKENVLRSYAELENYRARATREAESTRKFSIQGFSKALLDVADNMERALSCVPEDFASKEAEEVKKLLKTMVEGVKMTDKQLSQVYKKFGVERFDPVDQVFDPNIHLAICEVTDPKRTAGTIANVFKPGYMLHDRVLRPAEVSVVKDAPAS